MATQSDNLIRVSPESLVWARERNGYDLPTAAARLGWNIDDLAAMEDGELDLTPPQIRKAASTYQLSPAVFFLAEPPTERFKAPRDFRNLQGESVGKFTPQLIREIDRVHAQIRNLRQLQSLHVVSPSYRPVRIGISDPIEATAQKVLEWCFPDPVELTSMRRQESSLIRKWIEVIEAQGVVVTQVSNIELLEMRGCCFSDDSFPVIILNGADALTGRLFTLVHELIHVLLGVDVIINGFQSRDETEVFCNAVAAAVLIPRAELVTFDLVRDAGPSTEWSMDDLGDLIRPFGISTEAMNRRLLTLGKQSRSNFEENQNILRTRYGNMKVKTGDSDGGPKHDIMLLRNLGRFYVRAVLTARDRGLLNELATSDFLFSKVRWASELEKRLAIEDR